MGCVHGHSQGLRGAWASERAGRPKNSCGEGAGRPGEALWTSPPIPPHPGTTEGLPSLFWKPLTRPAALSLWKPLLTFPSFPASLFLCCAFSGLSADFSFEFWGSDEALFSI